MTGALCLFLSRGRGLAHWQGEGTIDRELEVYRRLAQRGWHVTVIGYDAAPASAFEHDWFDLVTQWPFGLLRGRLRGVYEAALPHLHRRLAAKRPVIVSNQASMGNAARLAASAWKAPLVARGRFVFGATIASSGRNDARAVRRLASEKAVYRAADAGVVTAPALRDWLVAHYGMDPERTFVIPNPVDTDLFRPGEGEEPDRVVMVGRLAPVKRIEPVIRAMAGTPWVLELIGDGPERAALAQEAAQAGVRLEFSGRVANGDLPARLRKARAYVLSNCVEGHPKALIEAMACGLACIGARVPGIAEVIADGRTGLLVEPQPAAIRAALDRVMGDRALRQSLQRQARAFAVDAYSTGCVAEAFERVLLFAAERRR